MIVAIAIVGVVVEERAAFQRALLAFARSVGVSTSSSRLRWLLAVLPGAIVINHVVYLATSRRKQFRQALGQMDQKEVANLEDLYFGYGPLTIRYLIPALLVTILTATAIAALTNPACYLAWLYIQPAANGVTSLPQPVNPVCGAGSLADIAGAWPPGWAGITLSGAAFGFMGAYIYLVIMLTDRARQRDITTGIAVWAAAMPVLGPLMGGIAALLILSGTNAQQASFTQYAVYFVAGMLPRQFAQFIQAGVSKMFQSAPQLVLRTQPLTLIRGISPDVASRLEEEGIEDVTDLAYTSPHQLMRATTYGARQITNWIDEALLIVNLPEHWQLLEKLSITGAMDLAWYQSTPDSIKTLADEIKFPEALLKDTVTRLSQDAQVLDLYTLYWDHTGPPPIVKRPPQQPPDGALISQEITSRPEIRRPS